MNMQKKSAFRFTAALVFMLGLLFAPPFSLLANPKTIEATQLSADAPSLFQPEPKQSDAILEIVRTLEKYHYKNVELNDDFSGKVLDQYLQTLDPAKSHFLQSDIDEFQKKYRHALDDDLKNGELNDAFSIYNRFHQRRIERLEYMLALVPVIKKDFDFTKDTYLDLDRKHMPWLTNIEEAHTLWWQLVKNDVLNMRISGKNLDEITPVLEKRYTDQLNLLKKTHNNDVFEFFVTAFTHSYDPHTDFFPPRESENFDIHMRLSLEGIGAMLQREDEYVKVVQLITGGPAERSKLLKPADRIVGVGQGLNGEIVDVVGWRLDEVVDMIRGPKGSIVRLNIIPADATDLTQTKVIQLARDKVKLEEQSAQKKVIDIQRGKSTYKIGVIELPTFYVDFQAFWAGDPDYRSSTRDVERLLQELKAEKIDALVIDLRNNGGGSLQEANDLTGLFIPSGPVVQIRNQRNKIETLEDNDPKVAYSGPLAVLVNRLSASASEIFAGAIQDHGRGIIIGSQTFGKGTVQNMKDLTKLASSQLKYTQAKFYRISGESTQERGIIPDITFPELLNKDEIGESSLPEALPWDHIPPAKYHKLSDLHPAIQQLVLKHQQRVANNPDFNYLNERLAFLKETREKTRTSLNEAERLQERQQAEKRLLEMENRRRLAKSLEPFKTFAAMEAEQESEDTKKDPVDAFFVEEAGNILLDWISLTKTQVAAQ